MPKHPGRPKGSDTVPAWLTPGEFVMNAEAARMFAPQIQAMNDRGRAVQKAQGGTIPEMGTVPIPTTPNPSAAYHEGGAVTKSIVPKARKQPPAWMNQIEMREGGLKREIYIDSEGYPTVGIGHRLPDEYKSKKGQVLFSDDQLNKWFTEDIAKATASASDNISNFDSLDNNVQGALINQAFQLGGTGQKGFEKMIKAIEDGDMNKAASEALDSNWFSQTPKRALDLASILRGEEPKMEYNKGGPVPRYYGLGDWVRSLFGTDDDDRFTMPDATALSGTPNYMFSNKNDIVVPPNVQTKINTDGSYFNPPYAGEPLHMGDSNFDVPEPPKFSDQDLIQNSSNALKDVPLISLKDDDLGALKELGNDQAEDVLKQRRIANEYGSYVPTNFNPERRRLEDEAYNRFGMNLNDDNTLSPVEKPVNLDPRIGVPEYYGVPKDYGSGMSLNEDARASLPPRFMNPRTRKIPTGPASYDQMPPRRTADIDIGEGSFGYGQFKRPDDPTFKQLIRDGEGNNVLRGDLGMPMDPVNVDANDPRIGVPEYYGVPKVNAPPTNKLGQVVTDINQAALIKKLQDLDNGSKEDQAYADELRKSLDPAIYGKDVITVQGDSPINTKYGYAISNIENTAKVTGGGDLQTVAQIDNRIDDLIKKSDAATSADDFMKYTTTIDKLKTLKENKSTQEKAIEANSITKQIKEYDRNINSWKEALNKLPESEAKDKAKAKLESLIQEKDILIGKKEKFISDNKVKVDTNTSVSDKDDGGDQKKTQEADSGGNVSPKNSTEVNLDNAKNSKNKQLENDPTIKDKGENAPPEVKAAAVEQVKSVFGEMFDVEELTRMAILYLGARATGASGSQAMAFAGKSYLSRLDNKYKQNKFNEHYNSLLKGNNFTRDSMELYKYTKDPNVLVTKSSIQSNIRRVDGGSIFYPKVKTAGVAVPEVRLYKSKIGPKGNEQTVYTFADGSIANLENFHQERGLVAGTDEYQESINKYKTSLEKVVTPKFNAFKPDEANEIDGNPKVWKMINGKQGDFLQDAAAFSKEVRYNTGQILETSIIDNAFENLAQDVADDKIEGSIRFKNYLDDAYIKANVGFEGRFKYGKNKSKTDDASAVQSVIDSLSLTAKKTAPEKFKATPDVVLSSIIVKKASDEFGLLFQEHENSKTDKAKSNTPYGILEKKYLEAGLDKQKSLFLYYLENAYENFTIDYNNQFLSNKVKYKT